MKRCCYVLGGCCVAFMNGGVYARSWLWYWCRVSRWARACAPSQVRARAERTQTGTADITEKKNTWEKWINCACFLTFSSPLARTFSLPYCPYSPSNTLSFSICSASVWHHLFLSSPAPLRSPSLRLLLPIYPPCCKVCNPFPSFSPVVYFPLYLGNYLSALSPRRTPCHPSIYLYVKYLHLLSLSYSISHSLPSLISPGWPLHLSPHSLHPSISPPLISALLLPACLHLSIPPPGHGPIEIQTQALLLVGAVGDLLSTHSQPRSWRLWSLWCWGFREKIKRHHRPWSPTRPSIRLL